MGLRIPSTSADESLEVGQRREMPRGRHAVRGARVPIPDSPDRRGRGGGQLPTDEGAEMSDDHFASPNRKPRPPRQPVPGEHLWTLRKGTDTMTAELRTSPAVVELQLLHNGEWYYGRRHDSRAFAIAEGEAAKADLEKDGGPRDRERTPDGG
jgi:hypothetical protein